MKIFNAICLIIVLFTNWNSKSKKLTEKWSFAQKIWELVSERRDCFLTIIHSHINVRIDSLKYWTSLIKTRAFLCVFFSSSCWLRLSFFSAINGFFIPFVCIRLNDYAKLCNHIQLVRIQSKSTYLPAHFVIGFWITFNKSHIYGLYSGKRRFSWGALKLNISIWFQFYDNNL